MVNKYNYGKGADIWATGVSLHYILTNAHPLLSASDNIDDKIKDKILKFDHFDTKNERISPLAKHLLERMIAKEQTHRYSASEAL